MVDGDNVYGGRVEVCINNLWGSICYGGISSRDATVVCRQQEFGEEVLSMNIFSMNFLFTFSSILGIIESGVISHSGPVFALNFTCYGNESNLTGCSHAKLNCNTGILHSAVQCGK